MKLEVEVMTIVRWGGFCSLGDEESVLWLVSLIIEWLTGRRDLVPRPLVSDF